jgi:hypothetical protein
VPPQAEEKIGNMPTAIPSASSHPLRYRTLTMFTRVEALVFIV